MYTDYNYNNQKSNKLYNNIIIVLVFLIIVGGIVLFINMRGKAPEVTISFVSDSLTLRVGDSIKTNITLTNHSPNIRVTYKSTNEAVATVDLLGNIKGISMGITEIIATYDDNDGNNVSDKLVVIVNKALDKDYPVIAYELINGNKDIWNNTGVSVKVSASDNEQVRSLKYSVNCGEVCNYIDIPSNSMLNFNEDGDYLINILAIDNSNNETKELVNVKVDKTKPIANYNVKGGTYYENKSVTITAIETGSGVKEFSVKVYKDGVLDNSKSKSNITDISYNVNLNSDAKWKIVTYIVDNANNLVLNSNSLEGYTEEYTIDVKGYREGPGGEKYSKTISFNGRTYKIFKQARYRDVSFWDDGNLADNGCGPSALAIILSGYMDNITPIETAAVMKYGTFDNIERTVKHFGMNTSGYEYYNSNDNDENRIKQIASKVRAHLNQGKPLIVLIAPSTNPKCPSPGKYSWGNHFMAILGEKENGELIIGQSGSGGEGGTLENLIRYYMPGGRKGFLFIEP